MSVCNYCNKQIHWFKINGKNKPFDDSAGTTYHQCEQFKQAHKTIEQRLLDLEERMQIDHNLLVKMISKNNGLEERLKNEV